MKRQGILLLSLFVALLAFANQSRADSDGNFCASKGYLAYELRHGITPGVMGHVLRVVRFEPQRGIYLAGEVTLLDFEVYHLICSEDQIEISGWRTVFTKYLVKGVGSGKLRSFGPTEYPGVQWSVAAKDGPAPSSLSIYGPETLPLRLESVDAAHGYELRRELSRRDAKGGLEFDGKSELVQLDERGTVLQHFILYETHRLEAGE